MLSIFTIRRVQPGRGCGSGRGMTRVDTGARGTVRGISAERMGGVVGGGVSGGRGQGGAGAQRRLARVERRTRVAPERRASGAYRPRGAPIGRGLLVYSASVQRSVSLGSCLRSCVPTPHCWPRHVGRRPPRQCGDTPCARCNEATHDQRLSELSRLAHPQPFVDNIQSIYRNAM